MTPQSYTKEQARENIAKLVDQFHDDEHRLQDAQEMQLQANYIELLFEYLNWNIQGRNIGKAQWEVFRVETDRQGKRPDYTFQLGGQNVFVLDAKKVKLDMHDPQWLWQVYRYGHSTQNYIRRKVDFGILTDFQEFVLIDCKPLAKTREAVLNFRVPAFDWRYPDYVKQFDLLWHVFERNNMLAASRERKDGLWSYSLTTKQAKASPIKPDKGFLDMLDNEDTGWRVRLAKDMKRCNPELTGEVITAAVQLVIDRLVFIKALSDRDIDDDYLAKLAATIEADGLDENDRDWFEAARQPIFDRLNKFYNGSIFEPRPEENILTSNKIVRGILREMEPAYSPYDLSVLPVHILGTIYERFLGNVVRTTDHRVKIEEKPEVRKAGGVYYTPKYVVDYIVAQTVGKLLEDCKTPDDVAKLKILDPACGSGSFLIGAYDALIEWHRDYYSKRAKPDREAAYRDSDGGIHLTAKLKKQILVNNIFGVDIDQQAVEVTRFSLSLKALEDTRKNDLWEERKLWKDTVLPDLSHNIVCGNSLIGTDVSMFDDQERKKINPMDYDKKFPSIIPPGFHAVIGNPPYVRQESLKEAKSYFETQYESFAGTADLYTYFMERAVRLLRDGGRFAYVVSSSLLRATYAEALRETLKKHAAILRLVDFGGHAVFTDAKDTYVCIPVFTKGAQPERIEISRVASIKPDAVEREMAKTDYTIPHGRFSRESWSLKSDAETALFAKIVAAGKPLGGFIGGRMYRGALTGLNEALVINSAQRKSILAKSAASEGFIKLCRGGEDCREYHIEPADTYMIVIPCGTTRQSAKTKAESKGWAWLVREHAGLALHLAPFENALRKRQDKGEFWWELRPCDYYGVFDQPKIVFPDICKHPRFCYDDTGFYLMNTAYALGTGDKYLLGILNSALFWFAIGHISIPFGVRAGEFRYRLIYQYMEKVPIRVINPSDQADKTRRDRMAQLVEQMLEAKKQWASAQTEKDKTYYADKCNGLDEQIDALVYELYCLTPDEIKLVESAT